MLLVGESPVADAGLPRARPAARPDPDMTGNCLRKNGIGKVGLERVKSDRRDE
jgi:hypothetical protein